MACAGARVTVTTSATALYVADTGSGSYSVLVRNKHASAAIDLGGSDVASGAGFELAAGESISFDVGAGDILYGIAASGTVICHVLRAGVG